MQCSRPSKVASSRQRAAPADRRALRAALWREREAAVSKRLVGFDFDCTLTVRHFYKVFAWGYHQGHLEAIYGHGEALAHGKAFVEWCRKHGIEPEIKEDDGRRSNDHMVEALACFCRCEGEATFKELFREIFLGGDTRVALVAAWLEKMRGAGVEFAIVTAGISTAVLRALTLGAPEWLPFFSASSIWDSSQARHSDATLSVTAKKALMLRDISPSAKRILLVDDSLSRDRPPKWVLEGAGVETFELPYEGPGVDEESLKAIEAAILR